MIQHILHDDWQAHWKGEGLAAARAVMGEGLATSHGGLWRRQRRAIQPAFAPEALRAMVPQVEAATQEMLDAWRRLPKKTLDVAQEMQHLTLKIMCRFLFGAELTPEEGEQVAASVLKACAYISHKAWSLVPWPESFPTPANLAIKRALAVLERVVQRLLSERRRSGAPGEDLLGQLLRAQAQAGQAALPDRLIRDELVTQLVAGYETPANALAWTFALLAKHPQEARRVQGEAQAALEAPASFDPQRWTPAREAGRPRYAYFPFGGGIRTCIGNTFAMQMMKAIVALVLEAFELRLLPRSSLRPQAITTLRPRGGVWLELCPPGAARSTRDVSAALAAPGSPGVGGSDPA